MIGVDKSSGKGNDILSNQQPTIDAWKDTSVYQDPQSFIQTDTPDNVNILSNESKQLTLETFVRRNTEDLLALESSSASNDFNELESSRFKSISLKSSSPTVDNCCQPSTEISTLDSILAERAYEIYLDLLAQIICEVIFDALVETGADESSRIISEILRSIVSIDTVTNNQHTRPIYL
jgi:hypothetical protein